jgi:anti-sigma B factor antagonist
MGYGHAAMAHAAPLRIDVRESPAEVVLVAEGDIDLDTAPLLSSRVEEAASSGAPQIIVNCERVSFVDSAGLRALVIAHHDLGVVNVRFGVRDPSPALMRLLEITSLDDVLLEP